MSAGNSLSKISHPLPLSAEKVTAPVPPIPVSAEGVDAVAQKILKKENDPQKSCWARCWSCLKYPFIAIWKCFCDCLSVCEDEPLAFESEGIPPVLQRANTLTSLKADYAQIIKKIDDCKKTLDEAPKKFSNSALTPDTKALDFLDSWVHVEIEFSKVSSKLKNIQEAVDETSKKLKEKIGKFPANLKKLEDAVSKTEDELAVLKAKKPASNTSESDSDDEDALSPAEKLKKKLEEKCKTQKASLDKSRKEKVEQESGLKEYEDLKENSKFADLQSTIKASLEKVNEQRNNPEIQESITKILQAHAKNILPELEALETAINTKKTKKELESLNRYKTFTDLLRTLLEKEILTEGALTDDLGLAINKIAGIGHALGDLIGLPNFNSLEGLSRNTCWLNSCLTAMRLNPFFVELVTREIDEKLVVEKVRNGNRKRLIKELLLPESDRLNDKQIRAKVISGLAKKDQKEEAKINAGFQRIKDEQKRKARLAEPFILELGQNKISDADELKISSKMEPLIKKEMERLTSLQAAIKNVWSALDGSYDIKDALFKLDDLLHRQDMKDWIAGDVFKDREKQKDPLAFLNCILEKFNYEGLLIERSHRPVGSNDPYLREIVSEPQVVIIQLAEEKHKVKAKNSFLALLSDLSQLEKVEIRTEQHDQMRKAINAPELLSTNLMRYSQGLDDGVPPEIFEKMTEDGLEALMQVDPIKKRYTKEKDVLLKKVEKFVCTELLESPTAEEIQETAEKILKVFNESKTKVNDKLKEKVNDCVKAALGSPQKPEQRKISNEIAFPQHGIFKCSETTYFKDVNDAAYEITSFITHIGNSPDSGHYISYAKGEDGLWRRYDDSTVYVRDKTGNWISYENIAKVNDTAFDQSLPKEIKGSYVQFWKKISITEADEIIAKETQKTAKPKEETAQAKKAAEKKVEKEKVEVAIEK